jgi:SNF2 family DNA or RNA helicase
MLSATPFEDTTQLKAIGHALKIVHRNKWWNWCLSAGGCRPGSYGGLEYVGGEQTMSQIRSTWDDRMDRTRIEDVGDLPEFTMQTRIIDSNNCKAINNAYTELLATYAEETEFAIVRRLRYRQKIEHEKIKQLYELAQEFVDCGQKVIHFVNFTDTVDTLYELHEGEFGIVDGRVTGDKRQAVVDQFQAGKLTGLIVQLQSGGVGLNLQDTTGDAPRTAILNLTDSATLFRQATGRTFRDGSRSPCRFVVPLVAGTVEKEIEQNLERKFRNLASLTDADFRP